MKKRENWTSKMGFILAASGSAIGLGNIWRFPYMTGTNGGAIFLFIYLIAIILIGYPIIVSEISLGRNTLKNPVGAFKTIAPGTPWYLVGALGVLAGFVILSYYSVVAGWGMAYAVKSLHGFAGTTDFTNLFINHISGTTGPIFWHAIFMALTIIVIRAGVVNGIQRAVKFLMPLLLFIIIILIIRSITLPGASRGLTFYLKPDFSQITAKTFTDAISQAFFTLSLGMGAMLTYGSYLSKKDHINDSAAYVIGFDTLIAILAGFAIFPAVFALGLDPNAGPGLTFITLPAVFVKMPFGNLFSFLFFILITIASLTSSISLLEVVVAYLVDERKWDRKKASVIIGMVIFSLGIPTILGYSSFSNIRFLRMDIFDTYDWFANDIFLPLGALLTSIFVGYVWGTKNAIAEANQPKGKIIIGTLYSFLLRYVVPAAIILIMLVSIWQTFNI